MTPIAVPTSRLSAPSRESEADPIALLASTVIRAGRKRRAPEQPPAVQPLTKAETARAGKPNRQCGNNGKKRGAAAVTEQSGYETETEIGKLRQQVIDRDFVIRRLNALMALNGITVRSKPAIFPSRPS
jgi:hypothetical protein